MGVFILIQLMLFIGFSINYSNLLLRNKLHCLSRALQLNIMEYQAQDELRNVYGIGMK